MTLLCLTVILVHKVTTAVSTADSNFATSSPLAFGNNLATGSPLAKGNHSATKNPIASGRRILKHRGSYFRRQESDEWEKPRQPKGTPPPDIPTAPQGTVDLNVRPDPVQIAANRKLQKKTRAPRTFSRTTPYQFSFTEACDHIALNCMKAYDTGQVCGRTSYYWYFTFKNYCMLDYINCMERYDLWFPVYMGPCYNYTVPEEYLHYPYKDDYFLDHYYVFEDAI